MLSSMRSLTITPKDPHVPCKYISLASLLIACNIVKSYFTYLYETFNFIFIIRKCGLIYTSTFDFGTALTIILPILFLYLNTVTVTAGTFQP
jgi:hypothetical protein